jgi:penicillin-insensitive murein endopeptidase
LVGDLSARRGGKIPGHHSHRTGRDVDLLYYVMTPSGAPVESPGFIRFASDGLAKLGEEDRYLRLDVERQWLLVRALLLSKEADVQWMFASRDVEALLIDHARARGEDPFLIWRAETMLLQPGDSTPHDDHLHLRIACAPEEELAGCQGGGPRWPWLPPEPTLGELDRVTLEQIAHDDPFDLLPSDHAAHGS